MIAQQAVSQKELRVMDRMSDREPKVDPMWSLNDDERRLAISRRAALAARKALSGK